MNVAYYCLNMGRISGPFSIEKVNEMIQSQQITEHTLIRIGTVGSWHPVTKFSHTAENIANAKSEHSRTIACANDDTALPHGYRRALLLVCAVAIVIPVVAVIYTTPTAKRGQERKSNPFSKHYTDPGYDPMKELSTNDDFRKALRQEIIRLDAEQRELNGQ